MGERISSGEVESRVISFKVLVWFLDLFSNLNRNSMFHGMLKLLNVFVIAGK